MLERFSNFNLFCHHCIITWFTSIFISMCYWHHVIQSYSLKHLVLFTVYVVLQRKLENLNTEICSNQNMYCNWVLTSDVNLHFELSPVICFLYLMLFSPSSPSSLQTLSSLKWNAWRDCDLWLYVNYASYKHCILYNKPTFGGLSGCPRNAKGKAAQKCIWCATCPMIIPSTLLDVARRGGS